MIRYALPPKSFIPLKLHDGCQDKMKHKNYNILNNNKNNNDTNNTEEDAILLYRETFSINPLMNKIILIFP